MSPDIWKHSAGERDGHRPESSLLSRCSQHKWEWLDLLWLPKWSLQTFWQITLLPIVPPSPGKKAAGLPLFQPAANPAAHNQVWHPTRLKDAYRILSLVPTATKWLLNPPCIHLHLPQHTCICWGSLSGAARGWWWGGRCWVRPALSPGLLLTSGMRKIALFSFYHKDKKQKLGKVNDLFIFTNNFQINFL